MIELASCQVQFRGTGVQWSKKRERGTGALSGWVQKKKKGRAQKVIHKTWSRKKRGFKRRLEVGGKENDRNDDRNGKKKH